MVRAPFIDKNGVKKGAWSPEEDHKLRAYIVKYGHGKWLELPKLAGLSRCGKSCRLRWLNHLRPGVKHGNYSKEEEDLIINLGQQLGNKWSKIAAKLPGRTDNGIKNHWHNHLKNRTKNPQNGIIASLDASGESITSPMVENSVSPPILESNPLSTWSGLLSPLTSDRSHMVDGASTSSNIVPENARTSLQTYQGIYADDFWTQAFVYDQDCYGSPLLDDQLTLSSYVERYEDTVDLYHQVMQELPGNHCAGSCFI